MGCFCQGQLSAVELAGTPGVLVSAAPPATSTASSSAMIQEGVLPSCWSILVVAMGTDRTVALGARVGHTARGHGQAGRHLVNWILEGEGGEELGRSTWGAFCARGGGGLAWPPQGGTSEDVALWDSG